MLLEITTLIARPVSNFYFSFSFVLFLLPETISGTPVYFREREGRSGGG